MTELFIMQTIIVVVLLTYLLAEEYIVSMWDQTTSIDWWEAELDYRRWIDGVVERSSQPVPDVAPVMDEVAVRMSIAGWHPTYGAHGWAGVPDPQEV